uniref:Uncharacterized protein n=1 Tax=mine drainage metagenome TaxID=410659 RepID=E6QL70_9ZZZZ
MVVEYALSVVTTEGEAVGGARVVIAVVIRIAGAMAAKLCLPQHSNDLFHAESFLLHPQNPRPSSGSVPAEDEHSECYKNNKADQHLP